MVALLGSLPLLFAACTSDDPAQGGASSAVQQEWTIIPLTRVWISAPDARLAIQRWQDGAHEQRVALPNVTAMPGDNFIYLRSITRRSPGRMRINTLIEQSGGLPVPFRPADLTVMRTREDGVGAVIWAEWTSGAGTLCVLAIRRMTQRDRILPPGTSALDAVMRNCVTGSTEEALAPLIGNSALLPASARGGQHGMQPPLSPLAAPLP